MNASFFLWPFGIAFLVLVFYMFSFPWKVIWRVKATMKIAFFVCIAALEKILMIISLVKRECL